MDWLSNAADAAASVTEGLDWGTGGWVVGALVALGFIRKISPLLGPMGATIANSLDGLARIFLPQQTKEAQARTLVAEESLWQIVEAIEAIGADDKTIQKLKKAISDKTPAQFNALFDEWKKARAAEKAAEKAAE